ncbi:hypothetical protein CHLRE_09g405150v5 [Chlamydomonas reinhardtii]|uniref:Pseudouridine synthase I TruA alpha/beta domain-containing protein n=1 Tax=Chlamydomonas reinhardtii TaxID=3055 RepID=A0A2K3DF61_CHLRE|nr:uncharacterized protein CHLRE_09g405150v5 [Chlamydomonas reinhardtii]PNW79181.1 hypothetical protein CHLRE_09g405150v5 [Chlamydomonas reinhardtii]
MLFGGAAAPLGRALAPARHAATAHAVRPSVSSPAVRSSAAPLALPSSYPRTHHAQPAFAPPSAPAAPGTAAGCWGPPSPRGTAVFARAGLAAGGQGSAAGTGWRREEEDERIPVPEGAVPRRLKMVVAYDGSEFAGFQFQPGKVRTVQGELERCAKRLFVGCSRMVGSSRTDGGAHAYGQVVHFDVYGERDNLESDTLYYNSFLPPDVRVLELSYAEEGFDSHFSACGKTYIYKFAAGLPDPMQAKYRWWVYDRWCERSRGKPSKLSDIRLDVGAMCEAGQLLLGRHDFSAFMDAKRPAGLGSAKRKNPKLAERGIKPERTSAKNTRILSHLSITEGVSALSGGQEVTMEVTGNGFLYRMVRMLAAGLVEVGHGRITPQGLLKLLEKGDRSALPEAAPPTGLYLASVHYAGDAVFESRIQAVTDRIRLQAGSGSFGFGSRPAAGAAAAGDGASSSGALAAAGAEAEAEAVEVAAELRQTQGQKAAALMRAAAAARRAAAADAGGGGEGGAGEAGEEGLGLALVGTDGRVDYSKLKDRDDDQ